LVNSKT